MSCFLSILVNDVCLLLAVAFFTLLERKVLGYIQLRKGPNKVGYFGIFQPFADAIKLFSKERISLNVMNFFFLIFPYFSLFLTLVLLVFIPSWGGTFIFSYFSVFLFLCISSLSVYSTLFAGWSSNSKYALLGALRAVAQTISYEVSMVLVLMNCVFVVGSFCFIYYGEFQNCLFLVFLLLVPVFVVWLITVLAETNRAPFDFAEGESELVSGFNIEYGGGAFALLFLAEYGSILVMSLYSSVLFIGGLGYFSVCIFFGGMIAFLILWVRGSFPRMRYDQLMSLTWKSFLPFSLFYLFFSLGVVWIF
uniref:NADH-ubiquinone oxidoreductase chain 1 n=1 Tax=Paranemertes cf. peregrina SCS-2010 TaxID=743461 RepID=E7C1A9_9BILA|nr:NADH dehydrogenase subunit 1 [Paranemertes cf. peregrina SCS-2010]ADD62169.1 NADH dehydrogenase subunit 1 [Paranemertes cf. peregrina SCS-2010]